MLIDRSNINHTLFWVILLRILKARDKLDVVGHVAQHFDVHFRFRFHFVFSFFIWVINL